MYGCTPEYIARLCRSGEVAGYMEGRLWYVSRKSLAAFSIKKGKARDVRARRLSRERKKEYGVSDDHAALYRAIFEAVAALPRPTVLPAASVKCRPLHRRAPAERTVAALIALLAVFGNYVLITLHGDAFAAEARSYIRLAQSVPLTKGLSLERIEDYAQASASAQNALRAAYGALKDRLGMADKPSREQGILPRPIVGPLAPQEAATATPDVIRAKTLRAEELCIGAVCLTEGTLLELTEKR